MIDSQKVKQIGLECGADLVGIAPIDRFSGLPSEMDPRQIQPDAKSLVVLAFRIPRGALRGVEEGTAWQTFGGTGLGGSICVEATYQVCRRIESEGWETVPLLMYSSSLRRQGVRARLDKPEPNVIPDLHFAAWAAGLGEMGRGQFFLTPEFGPRQIFTGILTDLSFQADPIFPGGLCDDCGACAAACPARALDPKDVWEDTRMPGCRCYRLRIESCRVCETGIVHWPYSDRREPCRIGAACGRACVAHLEDSGRLSRRFHSLFRAAEPLGGFLAQEATSC